MATVVGPSLEEQHRPVAALGKQARHGSPGCAAANHDCICILRYL